MLIPNAEQIEGAVDNLQTKTSDQDAPYPALGQWTHEHQLKELESLPDSLPARWGFGGPNGELDINTKDLSFQYGYFLGLQTARIVLMGSTALILKGVKPEDVL
jgi:hypothetical protein